MVYSYLIVKSLDYPSSTVLDVRRHIEDSVESSVTLSHGEHWFIRIYSVGT